ncbi:hypothetical protein CXB51_001535 [Gossypium anomalum]|uniref:RNase H type-1 domain-containing protein n=1 Tax=Gossypium anomalum TaxID=47600 RepID=A0A8J6A2K6_9ROSI|nr:hypothetical protein CXB51_001535 [Gossypium anomalum]
MEVEMLPKIHVFCWRVGHNILSTYANISSIWQNFKKDCPKCGAKKETFIHALKDCPMARTILILGGFNNRLLGRRGRRKSGLGKGKNLYHDFKIHNLVNNSMLTITLAYKKWEKPSYGYAKIKFDASVSYGKVGFGVIVKESDGFMLGGSGGFKDKIITIECAELVAFEESLKVASAINILKSMFESDCASLVNRVDNRGKDITILGSQINEAYKNLDKFVLANVV